MQAGEHKGKYAGRNAGMQECKNADPQAPEYIVKYMCRNAGLKNRDIQPLFINPSKGTTFSKTVLRKTFSMLSNNAFECPSRSV